MSDQLTPRERDIMGEVVKGMTARQISKALGISERTVEIHRAHVIAKLGAKNIIHAAVLFDRDTVTRDIPPKTDQREGINPTEHAVLDRLQKDRTAATGATWLRLVDEAMINARLALITSRPNNKLPHLIAAAARLIQAAELLGAINGGASR